MQVQLPIPLDILLTSTAVPEQVEDSESGFLEVFAAGLITPVPDALLEVVEEDVLDETEPLLVDVALPLPVIEVPQKLILPPEIKQETKVETAIVVPEHGVKAEAVVIGQPDRPTVAPTMEENPPLEQPEQTPAPDPTEDTIAPEPRPATSLIESAPLPVLDATQTPDDRQITAVEPTAAMAVQPTMTFDQSQRPESTQTVVRPRPVEEQIVAAVVETHEGETEVRLDPVELGSVNVRIQETAGGVNIVLTIERADTGDLMRRSADQLVQSFRDAGYDSVNLSFEDKAQDRGNSPRRAPYAQTFDSPDEPEARRFVVAGVDLRL